MKSRVFVVLVLSMLSSSAYAETFGTYLSVYHFDGNAFGKAVASVRVENAVVIEDGVTHQKQNSPEGEMNLARIRDHFFGKRIIRAESISGLSTSELTVKYHVKFTDGTETVQGPFVVQVREVTHCPHAGAGGGCPVDGPRLEARFAATVDSHHTYTDAIQQPSGG